MFALLNSVQNDCIFISYNVKATVLKYSSRNFPTIENAAYLTYTQYFILRIFY